MIYVQIQEWQQLKAKISQLSQQIKMLKQQNQQLKKKKKVNFQQNVQILSEINCHNSQINQQNPEYQQKYFIHENKYQQNNKKYQQNTNYYQQYLKQYPQNNVNQFNIGLNDDNKYQKFKLVQKICIFGPELNNLNDITFKNDQKQYLNSCLYYPQNQFVYQKYGNYIHPQMIRIKPILGQKKNIQAHKILYNKIKNQHKKVFIFQAHQNNLLNSLELLHKVNQSKFLYGITIQFKDFIIQQKKLQGKKSKNLKSIYLKKSLLNLDIEKLQKQQLRLQTASLHDIEFQNQPCRMYLSTFSLTLFTYFPFIQFFQQIIANIMQAAKLKRIQIYLQDKKLKKIDVFYVIGSIKRQIQQFQDIFLLSTFKIGPQVQLKINNKRMKLCLNGQMLMQEVYKGWISRVLKLFNRNNLYQVYCLIMLQQAVYFVCEDSQILTYIILLFSSILSLPFSYPFPVISIIFSNQLLQIPFTSIIGIHQSIKWVQRPQIQEKLDLDNKNIVLITQKQIKVIRKSMFQLPRQSQLKQIFKKYYQKTKPVIFSLKDLLSKKQLIRKSQQLQQENSNVFTLFSNIENYMNKKILQNLPSKLQINRRAESLQLDLNPSVINQILDGILKEYKQKNKQLNGDEFLRSFVCSQIFSIFLSDYYKLR